MLLTLGPLQVKIKYTYTRGKTTYYQRAVPSDLHDRYPGKTIKKDLKTADPIRVARMVEALNKQYEAEWEALRSSPEVSAKALTVHADMAFVPTISDSDYHYVRKMYATIGQPQYAAFVGD